ncbi:MAG: cold shock and DUF1294 domain-containing protein [Planctomyces sp.]|nr:cold shock and DUF1294 domain-containing protein [Planctomyces sp.]
MKRTIGHFTMRHAGTLTTWNDDRGFGFITPDQGGEQIFVHIRAFPSGMRRPEAGIRVSFEVELAPSGKTRARAVQFAIPSQSIVQSLAGTSSRLTFARVLAIPCLLATVLLLNAQSSPLPYILCFYGVASSLAFVLYKIDKAAAIGGRRRTPESTLHLLGVVGGWPGALIAQHVFRHKVSKSKFLTDFWVTVIVNLVALVVVHRAPDWSLVVNQINPIERVVPEAPFPQKQGYLYIELNQQESRNAANLPTISPRAIFHRSE